MNDLFRNISVFFPSFYPYHLFLFLCKFDERNSASLLHHVLSRNGEAHSPSWKALQAENQKLHLSPWSCLIVCALPWNMVKNMGFAVDG